MFQEIFNALKKECALSNMSSMIQYIAHLMELIGEDYLKDKNMKNAVIDAICEIIQQHKDSNPS